ncbi:MAG: peroxidase-related enzyme [Cytophagales bacterium]|nr:peroxidase-related enzyme [Cytophagales bacterium]
MAYIKIIQPEEADKRLKEIYQDVIKRRGKLAEVHKVQSLNPETIVKHIDLYMSIMYGRSPLSRAQREMIGVVVSAANQCTYCMIHHGMALNHYWKDENKVAQLRLNLSRQRRDQSRVPGLNKVDKLLCQYARDLTKEPDLANEENHVKPLKQAGLDDRAILDATLVIAYFNFVNRMVTGLGVTLEEEEAGEYKY